MIPPVRTRGPGSPSFTSASDASILKAGASTAGGAQTGAEITSTGRTTSGANRPRVDIKALTTGNAPGAPRSPGYIRTLQVVNNDSLKNEAALHANGIPVSATSVGDGPFKLFQQSHRTGLVFGQGTPMVVGAKKDMGTNHLIKSSQYQNTLAQKNNMTPSQFSTATRQELEHSYAQDADDDEIKRPRVFEDSGMVRSKHQEMAARHDGTASDKSSKFVMSDLMNKHVPEHSQGTQPMSHYTEQMLANASPQERAQIQHALPKFDAMSPEQQKAYLAKGASGPPQPKYSTKPVLPHNETLITPRPQQDAIGVYVSPSEPHPAIELQKQYAEMNGGAKLPFMTYDSKSGQTQSIATDAVHKMTGG